MAVVLEEFCKHLRIVCRRYTGLFYLCTPSRHPCCNLQEDIDAVQTWSSDWNATFNSAKSQQMVVGRHGCETGGNLVLGGDKLQQVCTCLPSRLNSGLNAEVVRPCIRHIEKGCPKSCCPEKTGVPCTCQCRHMLHKTILRPRLEYASLYLIRILSAIYSHSTDYSSYFAIFYRLLVNNLLLNSE